MPVSDADEPWLPRIQPEPKRAAIDPRLATFGDVLEDVRIRSGKSQEQLALDAKISRNHMGAIERGERSATLLILFKVCEALDVKLGDLMCETERRRGSRPR